MVEYQFELLPLFMAAMNMAAGHAPMIAQVMDEYDFAELVGEMAAEGSDEDVDGADVLAAWLKAQGIAYAAIGREWGPAEARAIGKAYATRDHALVEGPGEPALSPKLKALAGVPAAAETVEA